MNEILKDFLDRMGAPGKYITGVIALLGLLWSIGLVNAPATAHDVEAMGLRVESVEVRTGDLETNNVLVRDDFEEIRTEQAVQGERIENNGQQIKTNGRKLDRIIDLLNRR